MHNHELNKWKKNPANRIRTSDLEMPVMISTTVSRSTNWAITGYDRIRCIQCI